MINKLVEEGSDHEKLPQSPESPKMMKDVQIQTPDDKEFEEGAFITPVKTVRMSDIDDSRDYVRINKALFSQESDLQKESLWKSERKHLLPSENSFQRRIRSGINTKDMMCSEALSMRRDR
mmetsp:Transcript_20518/g.22876  ORF Transcript_20518/g.22876 Transcript_20518/m.22876 type:complete len:121 (+) Transcript_20518:738-1100(+)